MVNLFQKQTVDTILGGFRKVISDLEAHAERQADKANREVQAAVSAQERAAQANAEVSKATSVADRLRPLFG